MQFFHKITAIYSYLFQIFLTAKLLTLLHIGSQYKIFNISLNKT